MRVVPAFLSAIIVTVLLICDQPARFRTALGGLADLVEGVVYDPELRFVGLSYLTEQEVREHLPKGKSVLWWATHVSALEATLGQNSLIAKAHITRCGGVQLSCFVIAVEERKPAFYVIMAERGWLMGEDGALIHPLPVSTIRSSYEDSVGGALIPLIEGLALDGLSPEIIRTRFNFLKSVIQEVEQGSGERVKRVEFIGDQEFVIEFVGRTFRVVLDAPDDMESMESRMLVADKAERLRKLIQNFGRSLPRIEKIDLAFNKLAVVRVQK